MRWWMISGGILVLAGTSGCGADPPALPASERASNVDGADGASSVATQAEEDDQPTEKIVEWEKRVKRNRTEATNAWKEMYEDQKRRGEWRGALRHKFSHLIDGLDEVEIREEYRSLIRDDGFLGMDDVIDRRKPETLRQYQGFLEDTLVDFGEIIDRRRVTADGMKGIVEWDEVDYARVIAEVSWSENSVPMEIRLSRESTWVYEAILRALAHTNRVVGATSYDNAAIKRIVALEIGQPAAAVMLSAKRSGLFQPKATVSGYGSMMSGYGNRGHIEGIGDFDATLENEDIPVGPPIGAETMEPLLAGRYVDASDEPLKADSDPVAEFKLLPVHLVVVMDQAKLPDFLVNLANSEMPVGVKYVQIQDRKQGNSKAEKESTASPNDESKALIPVEILGTIRIYNPPPPT